MQYFDFQFCVEQVTIVFFPIIEPVVIDTNDLEPYVSLRVDSEGVVVHVTIPNGVSFFFFFLQFTELQNHKYMYFDFICVFNYSFLALLDILPHTIPLNWTVSRHNLSTAQLLQNT